MGAKAAVDSGFDRVGASAAALWAAVFAGPVGFAAAEFCSYAFTKWTCTHENKIVQAGSVVIALVLTAAGMAVAWRAWQRGPREAPTDGSGSVNIARFLAALGVTSALLSAVAILALGVPQWVLDACH